MATPVSAPTDPGAQRDPRVAVERLLCAVRHQRILFPAAYFSHWWIYDPNGLGIPTDFVNVWAAGRLVLDGHPAQA